jgi:two-component system, oxyanion-binding sensor
MNRLRIGYVPLTDAAPLIIAVQKGFADQEGVAVDLVRETSWSSVRDRLVVGQLDGAHCLAPLAIATVLGLSHIGLKLHIRQIMSLNGNGISLSAALAIRLGDPLAPIQTRADLLVKAAREARRVGRPLTFATVFRFSCHTLLLRRLFELGGGSLEEDVDLVVLPPALMVEGLKKAVIDGFCVGSPWNQLAVERAGATLIATGHELLPDLAEKVLAVPDNVLIQDADAVNGLTAAIRRASDWLSSPGNAAEAATLLSAPALLDCPADIIERGLSGRLRVAPDGQERHEPQFLRLDAAAFPASPMAMVERIIGLMVAAGQIADEAAAISALAPYVSARHV